MATVIGDLFVRLGVNADQLNTGLSTAEKRLERFGTQLFFLGTRVTAGISVPVGLAMAKISEFGMGFDKAMTESLAIMGDVSADMRAEMENTAKVVSTTTKFSSKEAAEGYYSLASAGMEANEVVQALPIAAKFAQAGVFSLATATEFLAGAQAALGLKTENVSENIKSMGHIADVLTEANNRALGTIQDFAEALTNKAGAALRQTNKSVEEGVAVLAAYAEQNIKGKYAGQQLWMVIRDLGTYALKNADAFKKHKISVFDAAGSMRNMADIIADVERATAKMSDAQRAQMFLELGIPLRSVAATKALIGYSDAIRAHEAALKVAGGTTEEVANKQMQALQNQVLALSHQFENAAIDLFKSFIPVIQKHLIPAAEAAGRMLNQLIAVVDTMPDSLKLAALAAAGLVVAIGPIVAVIGSMTLLTSAAMRGLMALAGGVGTLATSIGMTAGVSNTLSKFLAIMPKNAAVAAAAAYDLAKANGVSGVFLNKAATAAANNAGWSGTVTNALLKQGAATSTIAVSTGTASSAMNLLGGTLTAAIPMIGKFGAGILNIGGSILKWKVATDLLWPSIKQLFSGWTSDSEGASRASGLLSNAWEGTKTVLSTFNDVVKVSGQGLALLTTYLQDSVDAHYASKAAADAAKEAEEGFWDAWLRAQPTIGPIIGAMADLNTKLDDQSGILHRLRTRWLELKMTMDAGGKDPIADLTTEIDRMRPKGLIPKVEDPFKKKLEPEFWMLGGQKAFDNYMRTQRPEGEMPAVEPKLTAAQTAAKNLADQWRENSKQVRAFKDAWASLTAVERTDASVLAHVWEAYDKLRQGQGVLIPSFEKLFEAQVQQQEMTKEVTFGLNEWGVVWSDAAIKMETEVGKVYYALTNLRDKASLDAFWKKNGETVQELIPYYNTLTPLLQVIVNRYQAWALATAKASGALQDHQAQVSRSIGDYLDETAAKLTDSQTQLTLFSKSYLDKELAGLKKGMAQQQLARKQSYNKQLASLAAFANNPVMFAVELARLNMADRMYGEMLEKEDRMGLYRIAQSVGVNKEIIKSFDHMTKEAITDIIRQKIAWDDLRRSILAINDAIGQFGNFLSLVGATDVGAMFGGIADGLGEFMAGAAKFDEATNIGDKIAGTIQQIAGAVKAFKAIQQEGSRTMRSLGGAAAGAQMGNSILPGWGALIGGAIGGIAGAFMADPDWKMVQKTVRYKWHESVTKELANQIDKDADVLGGHVNAMLMHLTDVAAESGGITAGNVGMWAGRLAEVFPILERGEMSAAQAAKTLDASFEALIGSGTTTNGFIADQIRGLVQLERQYKTGSAAIRDFVDAQLGMVSKGFGQVVGGAFGSLLPEGSFDVSKSIKKQETLLGQISDVKDRIVEINKKDNKTEQEKVELLGLQFQLIQLNNNLLREQSKTASAGKLLSAMSGPQGQETFDRLGRLAGIAFDAMIGSGKTFLETLDAIGPALDQLSAAQSTFGFASSEAFAQLLKFREFSTLNPELVEELDGLQNMMRGLTNLGFMTQESFADLGAEASSVFTRLVDQGLSSDEAMQLMQPTLQMLWELEKKFGYAADEATQSLINQALESGKVGEAYMSANDRMVLGIDRLISRFDLFLRHLGINVPTEAEKAANAVNDAGEGINPWNVDVNYTDHGYPGPMDGAPEPVPMAEGGILRKPILAGEAGPEAIVPLDKLFDELQTMNRHSSTEGYMPVTVQVGDQQLIKALVAVKKKNGW